MTKFETVKPSNRHGKKWTNGQYGQNGQGNFEARIEKRQASLPTMVRLWIGNGSRTVRFWVEYGARNGCHQEWYSATAALKTMQKRTLT